MVAVVASMSRAAAFVVTIVWYSPFAALCGGCCIPLSPHRGLCSVDDSARSVRAMMLRVFVVTPVTFVTHTSMRLSFTPVVRLGRLCIALS